MGALHVRFRAVADAHRVLSNFVWIAAVTKYRFGLSIENPENEICYLIQALKRSIRRTIFGATRERWVRSFKLPNHHVRIMVNQRRLV